jgi:hypothetical protein
MKSLLAALAILFTMTTASAQETESDQNWGKILDEAFKQAETKLDGPHKGCRPAGAYKAHLYSREIAHEHLTGLQRARALVLLYMNAPMGSYQYDPVEVILSFSEIENKPVGVVALGPPGFACDFLMLKPESFSMFLKELKGIKA